MTQRLVIDPVTRIEGRSKISIYLDDAGQVTDVRFHVTEFRGFERFQVGSGPGGPANHPRMDTASGRETQVF